MPPEAFDLASVDYVLTTTRSVRNRLDVTRPVEPGVIQECLDIAIQAPTGGNVQGWRWVIVTDAAKRAAVADVYRRAATPYLEAQATAVAPDNERQQRVLASARRLVDIMADVPVLAIPCVYGRIEASADAGFPMDAMAAGLHGSIWPAIWSFMLALRSRGLGSTLTTLHLVHADEVAGLLGIPEGVTQAALLPVAYFTGDTFKPAVRRPAREITYWDEWKRVR